MSGRRVMRKNCDACGRPIVFLRNQETNGLVPVDSSSARRTDTAYDPDRHVSHFLTCTDPDRFSGRRTKRGA